MNPLKQPASGMPRILVARGARAVEDLLLRHVEAMVYQAKEDLGLLARPIRLVVPSWSLRDHIAAILVRRFGGSLAGVLVNTLHRTALEILERAGKAPPRGGALFEVLVRRYSRDEPELHDELEHLMDGYAGVVGTVTDFMDAGFQAAHAEALDERLSEMATTGAIDTEVRRARAIVRVAARTERAMVDAGITVTATLSERAREHLEQNPDSVLPARAVLIHGFADATGLATDFMQALMRYRGAWVYLDHPPDPAAPERLELGISFTQRFANRLEQLASTELDESLSPTPKLTMLSAPGVDAEIRAVASRICTLLDEGVAPERIALVARAFNHYRIPIRLHFHRLGIPFSGIGALGPRRAAGRRIHALMEVLSQRRAVLADRWVDVLKAPGGCLPADETGSRKAKGPHELTCSDLRLSLRALGACRLSDVVALEVDRVCGSRGDFPLPSRRGLSEGGRNGEPGWGPRAHRRRMPGAVLRQTIQRAKRLLSRWEDWPAKAEFRVHLVRLQNLLRQELGWKPGCPDIKDVFRLLQGLSHDIHTDFELSYDEFVLIVRKAFSEFAAPLLGGNGGGVQILDVMEARGRTFEYLFITGLNRDVFPRIVREDPLLPDHLRGALTGLLPDIPIKQEGHDEDRFLFAELMSASPNVTLTWQTIDEQGKIRPASPLVERIRLAHEGVNIISAPSLYARPQANNGSASDKPLPVQEVAVLSGLYGTRAHYAQILPIALAETMARFGSQGVGIPPDELARSRVAVLNEFDPDRNTSEGRLRANQPGPYYGFLGGVKEKADPRLGDLFITRVENMAACPWQTVLKQMLRIESTPDPMEALPSIDAQMMGALIHAVLERIVGERTSDTVERADKLGPLLPWPVSRPDPLYVERVLEEEAEKAVQGAGTPSMGLARILRQQAVPFLECAWSLDWPEIHSVVQALGAEVPGKLEVRNDAVGPQIIRFKADRVDLEDGWYRFTDYKTGNPVGTGKNLDTRRRQLLKAVRRGEWLQAVAYVLDEGMQPSEGRYLFIKPDIPEDARVFSVTSEDKEFAAAFNEVMKTILRAMDQGTFFPRLVEPNGRQEPPRCRHCTVAQACLRGDSEARARLFRWIQGSILAMEKGDAVEPWERSLIAVWRLWEQG